MLALAGYRLGLSFRFYDPGEGQAIRGIGEHVRAAWTDRSALERFVSGLDVATYEFENVPVECAEFVAERVPLRPGLEPLAAGQDRVREKHLFGILGIPTAAFEPVDDLPSLDEAVHQIGLPAVLKTRRDGYDGKGQRVLRTPSDIRTAWAELGDRSLILEGLVDFDRELSVLGARGVDGSQTFYPCAENQHRGGILHTSSAPATCLNAEAVSVLEGYARNLMRHMDYVGVLALEIFEDSGRFLANEFAPRVHNSGHWTQDGAATCQFENHLRAICGWSLGPSQALTPTVMSNIIGTVPEPAELLSSPGARVHLYGKSPRPGRKLGHVNELRDEGPKPRDPKGRG